MKELAMKDCVQLVTIPNKQNIKFSVATVNPDNLLNSFHWLIDELKAEKENTQKVLVFCRKKSHVRDLYEVFHEALGSESYVLPTGQEPKDDRTRLFAMYHRKTHHLVKNVVEREFSKVDGTVRVVFCTIAFGMGVDVQGAYLAIHLGPSSTIDDYIQECGRVGRSNEIMSHAVMLKYSGCTRSKNIEKAMKNYINNTEICRRSLLMKPFLNGSVLSTDQNEQSLLDTHLCCDVCAKSCKCLCSCESMCLCNLTCNSEMYYSPFERSTSTINSKPVEVSTNRVLMVDHPFKQEVETNVKDELLKYRAKLANDVPDEQLLTGIDIATGFSTSIIENIVSNIWRIESLDSLKKMITFFNEDHALQSWLIVSSMKGHFPHIQDCNLKNIDNSLLELNSPTRSDYTSSDEISNSSDDSDVCVCKISNIVLNNSDSDDTD
jgi:hypothetical protein